MKRLFVAIKIQPDENFLSKYYFLRNSLKSNIIKWVEPDIMHLTLKFLGETPNNRIKSIKQILYNFSKNQKSLEIEFDHVGIFGSSYNPRVIWFGISDNEAIKQMGENLLSSFNENGFPGDRQNFVPHLTIARIKKINNKKFFQQSIDKVKEGKIQSFKIDEVILYQSILRPNGPEYIKLSGFKLQL